MSTTSSATTISGARPATAPTGNGQTFNGDKKHGQSLLHRWERPFIDANVARFPSWIMGHHLTMVTLFWSVAVIGFGWLAQDQPAWLFAMSAVVFGQWFTDSFDGSLGKFRGQGLVKWGFFMDHFLDLIFAGSIVIAYSLIAPPGMELSFNLLLLATTVMMGLSFLSFAATNQFQIAFLGIGPTEVRIGYIAINTVLFFTGTDLFTWAVPLALIGHVVAIAFIAWRTQLVLWNVDKAANVDAPAVG
jgi:hypothetical protein